MKDKDFQQLIDHELAQLEWTDQQRLDTLRKMKKEDRPIMKRKFNVAIIIMAILLSMSVTAVAAGLNRTTLQDFFDQLFIELDLIDVYEPVIVDESAVVNPVSQRHTSALVDVQVEEMYLSNNALYFPIRYTPKTANTLLFGARVNSVMLDGEEKDYWDLWDHKELALLKPGSVSIDDPNGRRTPIRLSTVQCIRDPKTGAITEMYSFRDAEELIKLRSRTGGTLMLRFVVNNLRNHEPEQNVLYVDFPQMESVEKDPMMFTLSN